MPRPNALRNPRRLAATLFGLSMLCTAGWAASAVPDVSASPEDVAAAAFAHMQAGDWAASAELFDPGELGRFRVMMMNALDLSDDSGEHGGLLKALFGPDATPQSLRELSDARFMAAIMSGLVGKTGVELREQRLFGHVAEDDDTVHVVARNTFAANELVMSKMEVVTLRRTPQGWRLALKGEMTGLAEALSAARQRKQAGEAPPTGD